MKIPGTKMSGETYQPFWQAAKRTLGEAMYEAQTSRQPVMP
jgi:hypothetical protein